MKCAKESRLNERDLIEDPWPIPALSAVSSFHSLPDFTTVPASRNASRRFQEILRPTRRTPVQDAIQSLRSRLRSPRSSPTRVTVDGRSVWVGRTLSGRESHLVFLSCRSTSPGSIETSSKLRRRSSPTWLWPAPTFARVPSMARTRLFFSDQATIPRVYSSTTRWTPSSPSARCRCRGSGTVASVLCGGGGPTAAGSNRETPELATPGGCSITRVRSSDTRHRWTSCVG